MVIIIIFIFIIIIIIISFKGVLTIYVKLDEVTREKRDVLFPVKCICVCFNYTINIYVYVFVNTFIIFYIIRELDSSISTLINIWILRYIDIVYSFLKTL